MFAPTLIGLFLASVVVSQDINKNPYLVDGGQLPLGGGRPYRFHPPGSPPPPDHRRPTGGNKTILEIITDDPQFSRLSKALSFTTEIADALNDSSSSVTFFAVPDWALPKKRRDNSDLLALSVDADASVIASTYTLEDAISTLEHVQSCAFSASGDKKDKRKKFLKIILRAILSYHIIPSSNSVGTLALNATHATNFSIPGVLGGDPQRISIQHRLLPPSTSINLFSRVVHPNVEGTNGIVHVINHPLLPPPPVFKELFIVPDAFATFTSALQHSGLLSALDLEWVHGKDGKRGSLEGAKTLTAFVPSNRVFSHLPWKLRLFLFSPFGAGVLQKVLQAHIIPDVAVFSDYVYNATKDVTGTWVPSEHVYDEIRASVDGRFEIGNPLVAKQPRNQRRKSCSEAHPFPRAPRPELIYATNFTLPTLLTNFTLDATVAKFNVTLPIPTPPGHSVPFTVVTKFWVQGELVQAHDIIGANGPFHVVSRLVNPWKGKAPKKPKDSEDDDEGEWQDWEDWMPHV